MPLTTGKEKVTEIIYLAGPVGKIEEYATRIKDRTFSVSPNTRIPELDKEIKNLFSTKSKTLREKGNKYRVKNKSAYLKVISDLHKELHAFIKKEKMKAKYY